MHVCMRVPSLITNTTTLLMSELCVKRIVLLLLLLCFSLVEMDPHKPLVYCLMSRPMISSQSLHRLSYVQVPHPQIVLLCGPDTNTWAQATLLPPSPEELGQ